MLVADPAYVAIRILRNEVVEEMDRVFNLAKKEFSDPEAEQAKKRTPVAFGGSPSSCTASIVTQLALGAGALVGSSDCLRLVVVVFSQV
jgi:hypothetical protein